MLRETDKKDIMYIGDFPLVKEQESNIPFSEYSSLKLKDELARAAFLDNAENPELPELYLNDDTICFTYLSLKRPAEKDLDWRTSICCKANRLPDRNYIEIEYLKDIWMEETLYQEFNNLLEQIKIVQPKFIILGGKWALLLLATYADREEPLVSLKKTQNDKTTNFFGGLSTFRSSILAPFSCLNLPRIVLIPIYNPAYHFIMEEKILIIRLDYLKLARINRELETKSAIELLTYNRRHIVGDEKSIVIDYLNKLYEKLEQEPTLVSIDVETRQNSIDCIGLAWEEHTSITIPFTYSVLRTLDKEQTIWKITKSESKQIQGNVGDEVKEQRFFWDIEDEVEINHLLFKCMLHKNCLHVGQNYNYDAQWYTKQWRLNIQSHCDTMILHHVLFNTLPKDLAFLASLYVLDYAYWKDDLDSPDNYVRWIYNGKDVCYTLSLANILLAQLSEESEKLQEFYKFQQNKFNHVAVYMMKRGIAVDMELKQQYCKKFEEVYLNGLDTFKWLTIDPDINLNSTPQMKFLYKDILKIKPLRDRKTKAETFNAPAMLQYIEQYPQYKTLFKLILELKSIKVFVGTFLKAKVHGDNRIHCNWKIAGTSTYRLASSKDLAGFGMNMQNIPEKGKFTLEHCVKLVEQNEFKQVEAEVEFE